MGVNEDRALVRWRGGNGPGFPEVGTRGVHCVHTVTGLSIRDGHDQARSNLLIVSSVPADPGRYDLLGRDHDHDRDDCARIWT